jgi:hypothetical protein
MEESTLKRPEWYSKYVRDVLLRSFDIPDKERYAFLEQELGPFYDEDGCLI